MLKLLLFSGSLLLLAAAPHVLADTEACLDLAGQGIACVIEISRAQGDCADGSVIGYTGVYAASALGSVEVFGAGYCFGSPGNYDASGNSIGVATSTSQTGYAFVGYRTYDETWYGEHAAGCDTYVFSGPTGFRTIGCPAGPLPNPGWGTLLP